MRELSKNTYPGRGIIAGMSDDGQGVIAYFSTGRSVNTRNRIIISDGDIIRTQAYDPALISDSSLIIYNVLKTYDRFTIVTNGDHTDTIYNYMVKGYSFEDALNICEFEPDFPIYTPRIAALVEIKNGVSFNLAVLRSDNALPPRCVRNYYKFEALKSGEGKIIHTYLSDGNPPPSFNTQPRDISIKGDIDAFSKKLWHSLNKTNRIFLFVRFIETAGGKYIDRIINALESTS